MHYFTKFLMCAFISRVSTNQNITNAQMVKIKLVGMWTGLDCQSINHVINKIIEVTKAVEREALKELRVTI